MSLLGTMPLLSMLDDLCVVNVLRWLSSAELSIARQTCKRFNALASIDSIWQLHLQQDFGVPDIKVRFNQGRVTRPFSCHGTSHPGAHAPSSWACAVHNSIKHHSAHQCQTASTAGLFVALQSHHAMMCTPPCVLHAPPFSRPAGSFLAGHRPTSCLPTAAASGQSFSCLPHLPSPSH